MMNTIATARTCLHRQLDPEAWDRKGLSPLNWALLALILVSIAFGVAATEADVRAWLGPHLLTIDYAILAVFAIEYLLRLATIGLNPRFAGPGGIVNYMLRPASIADLVVVLPLFLAAPPTWFMIFRLLRILRLVRLASLPHIHMAIREFTEALAAKRFELTLTGCLSVLLILVSSTTLYLAERVAQPEIFGSIPRAIWWSVVTFTTVGYGDAVPETGLGRFFAGAYAICGVGLVAMLTGVIASALSEAAELHSRSRDKDESGGGA